MTLILGATLCTLWDSLPDSAKERMCHDIWNLVATIRTIPRPAELQPFYCYNADGSPIWDPLLGNNKDLTPPIYSDDDLRDRIFDRYVRHNGLSYADGKDLPKMLPRSETSFFTHGDIAPRNIMVDESGKNTGRLDWESRSQLLGASLV